MEKRTPVDLRQATLRIARNRLKESGRVLIEAATGVGKTKIALDLAADYNYVVVLVPTDAVGQAWLEEKKKWEVKNPISIYNYRSAHKVNELLAKPDLVIMDECHHITELNLEAIKKFDCPIIALSATVDYEKLLLLKALGFEREIIVTLDEAQEHELIAPYEMHLIYFPLDNVTKNIEGGSRDKKFMTTEQKTYEYANRRITQAKLSGNQQGIQFAYLHRTRFLRTVPSRTKLAKKMVAALQRKYPNGKMLVFAPEIAICEELTPLCYYHSETTDEGFKRFAAGQSNILGSVNALSEGINVHADMALIMAGFAKERHTVQRLGRLLRKTEDGKMGKAFLLVARDTQDAKWAEDAVAGLTNVKKYNIESLNLS